MNRRMHLENIIKPENNALRVTLILLNLLLSIALFAAFVFNLFWLILLLTPIVVFLVIIINTHYEIMFGRQYDEYLRKRIPPGYKALRIWVIYPITFLALVTGAKIFIFQFLLLFGIEYLPIKNFVVFLPIIGERHVPPFPGLLPGDFIGWILAIVAGVLGFYYGYAKEKLWIIWLGWVLFFLTLCQPWEW
jgi:hypothetical protein